MKVDEEKRQLWFSAGGMTAGKDPYFQHYYRINLDGTGLTPLTVGRRQPHGRVLVGHDDVSSITTRGRTWRRVLELHRAEGDGFSSLGLRRSEIERGDIAALVKAGWRAPEVFVAKGRDGVTDIWGLVWKPTRLRSREEVSGDRDTSTPARTARSCRSRSRPPAACRPRPSSASSSCRWTAWARRTARRRFTTWRGRTSRTRAFPIASCGTRRSAAKIPVVRHHARRHLRRVGRRAELDGRAALPSRLLQGRRSSYAGCHDNRMDKIWWNEQWMGWPIGPQYAASSNVDHAAQAAGQAAADRRRARHQRRSRRRRCRS